MHFPENVWERDYDDFYFSTVFNLTGKVFFSCSSPFAFPK